MKIMYVLVIKSIYVKQIYLYEISLTPELIMSEGPLHDVSHNEVML